MPQDTPDLASLAYDDVDQLVDEDPIKLRDVAWAALRSLRANEHHQDAVLDITRTKLERLAAVRDELRDHMANLSDKQPWDNRAMFDRVLTALEIATKENP